MNTQSLQSFGHTGDASQSNQTSIINQEAVPIQNHSGLTPSNSKAYKLRVSGSARVVRCVARWGGNGFSSGVAKIFHAVFIASQPLTSLIEMY